MIAPKAIVWIVWACCMAVLAIGTGLYCLYDRYRGFRL